MLNHSHFALIEPNILTGLMYMDSVFLLGTQGYWGVTFEGTGGTEKHQYASQIKGQKKKNLRQTTGYA